MVTGGDTGWFPVDLSGATDGASIRERILATLRIPDEDHDITKVYRTEIRDHRPIGDALGNDELLNICEENGDAQRALHFMLQSTSFPSSSAILPPPPAIDLTLSTARTLSGDLMGDPPILDSLGGYEASDEGVSRRTPTSSAMVNNKQGAPYNRPVAVTSPAKGPRALPPSPSKGFTHTRSGSDQPPQSVSPPGWASGPLSPTTSADRAQVGMQIPRSASSQGRRVPEVWPGSPTAEPNVRPQLRGDSSEPHSLSNLNSIAPPQLRTQASTNSIQYNHVRSAPPTGPPPQPPPNQIPFQLPPFILSAASYARVSQRANGNSGVDQIDARAYQQYPSSQPYAVSQTPYASSSNANLAKPSGYPPPTRQNSGSQQRLVGARSFDNLRAGAARPGVTRPLPIGPTMVSPSVVYRATPAPIITNNLSHLRMDPSSSSSHGVLTSASPTSSTSVVGALPSSLGAQRPQNPARRNLYIRPNTADNAANYNDSSSRLFSPTTELRRTGAMTATRATGTTGGRPPPTSAAYSSENIRPHLPQRQPPPSHPPPQAPVPQASTPLRVKQTQPAASNLDSLAQISPSLSPRDVDGVPPSVAHRIASSEVLNLKPRKSYDTPISTSPRSDEATLRNQEWLPRFMDSRTPYEFDPTTTAMTSPLSPTPPSQPRRSLERIASSPSTPKSHRQPIPSSSSDESDETDDDDDGGTLWEKGNNHKPSLTPLRTNFKSDDAWLVRPTPEAVYDRLEAFFPGHNLDEPMIDAGSGSSSPTAVEPSSPFPPNQTMRDNKHRRSIRGIADERKKKLTQMLKSGFSAKADSKALLRRRSTKLWGSRVEELPMHAQAEDIPPVPELTTIPTFKWVKGDLIGKGTFGRVYLALNATTGDMMAVKQVEMPKTKSDQDDSRQRSVVEALKAESDTLSKLDHPHVVQYLGLEETPDFMSIFLEYIPGGSVGSCLRKYGKFSENVIKSFTKDILDGLAYLHSVGILHRDLKADNILVDPSGSCKISDFGISKRTERNEYCDAGSIFWMAPEVLMNDHQGYSAKIDIWSLGCVVLEMWAGRRPWNQENMLAVMFKLGSSRQAPPIPDDVVLGELAEDFRQKCFAINPDDRPTAAELYTHAYLTMSRSWRFQGFSINPDTPTTS
ncbi:hypothetical protein BS47DRAFT_1336478 [Hydnum rufescens UP504]|uniref:Protein kinase domain-containing protein n=1 Tax=Hydnum rufescens UP504 TaxID=1448309 RepID=A0A9P6B8W9_9AGAM|nr:hypothetical protein BS47DRAFT_1336478 [Hydnum rufescens UP504]